MESNCHFTYPVFLTLASRRCLVAGLGAVGVRKLCALLSAGAASVYGVDTRPLSALPESAQEAAQAGRLIFRQGQCGREDVAGCLLVFAATADKAENRRILKLSRQCGALCNCATEPDQGDFALPAVARRGQLRAAISTAGQSPHLARRWRGELEAWLAPKERLAWLMGQLRPLVLAQGHDQSKNAKLFAEIASSPLGEWLAQGRMDECGQWLMSRFPAIARQQICQILDGYKHAFA